MVERSQIHGRADVWLQVRRWTRQHAMLGWPCPPRSRPRWRSVRRPLSRRQAARAVGAATCPLVRPRATPFSLHSMSFPTNDSMPAESGRPRPGSTTCHGRPTPAEAACSRRARKGSGQRELCAARAKLPHGASGLFRSMCRQRAGDRGSSRDCAS